MRASHFWYSNEALGTDLKRNAAQTRDKKQHTIRTIDLVPPCDRESPPFADPRKSSTNANNKLTFIPLDEFVTPAASTAGRNRHQNSCCDLPERSPDLLHGPSKEVHDLAVGSDLVQRCREVQRPGGAGLRWHLYHVYLTALATADKCRGVGIGGGGIEPDMMARGRGSDSPSREFYDRTASGAPRSGTNRGTSRVVL